MSKDVVTVPTLSNLLDRIPQSICEPQVSSQEDDLVLFPLGVVDVVLLAPDVEAALELLIPLSPNGESSCSRFGVAH